MIKVLLTRMSLSSFPGPVGAIVVDLSELSHELSGLVDAFCGNIPLQPHGTLCAFFLCLSTFSHVIDFSSEPSDFGGV